MGLMIQLWWQMKTSKKTIKELAQYFDQELQIQLPLTVLANGSLVYKDFLIKKLPNNKWGIFNIFNKDLKEEYNLKSCALMGAKAYNFKHFNKCNEIKILDNNYWSNYSDTVIYRSILNNISDEKYPIVLTRLEESDFQANQYKHKISKLFKSTFV